MQPSFWRVFKLYFQIVFLLSTDLSSLDNHSHPSPLPTPLKTTFKVNHITQPFLIQVKAIKTNTSIKSPANSSASVYIKFLLVLCDILACRNSGLWYWHIESNFNLHYTLPILFAVFCVFLFHNMKGVSMPWLLRLISKTSVQNSSMN